MNQPTQPVRPDAGAADLGIPLEVTPARTRAGPSRGPDIDFGEVELIPPILDQGSVDKLVGRYDIPLQFEARASRPGEYACRPPFEVVAIYRDQLIAGLRLPIPQFLYQILTFWGIRITQLVPNAIRSILGFFIMCRVLEIPYSLDLFRSFFQMKLSGPVHGWFYFARRSGGELPTRELFTHTPSSIKGWKAQFFYVKNTGFPPLTWREETQVSDPIPSPLPAAELDLLVSSDARLSVKEFSNAQLRSAGLIRAEVNDPAPDLRPLTPEELTACNPFDLLFLAFLSFPLSHELTPFFALSEEVLPASEHRRDRQLARGYLGTLLSSW